MPDLADLITGSFQPAAESAPSGSPSPPAGFTLDSSAAPPPGFTLDQPTPPPGFALDKPPGAEPQTSAWGAFGHAAERGIAPAAFSLAGAGYGARLGAGAGALIPGLGETGLGEIGGGLLGAVVGGFGGSLTGSYLQGKATAGVPEETKAAFGQTPEQQAAEEKEHPVASWLGSMAPYAPALSPMTGAPKAAGEGLSTIEKLMASRVTRRALPAAVMGASEAAGEKWQGEPLNWAEIAGAAGMGAAFPGEWPTGRALTRAGEMAAAPFARPLENIAAARAATRNAPSPPQTPPAHEQAPEGLPAVGSAVGMRYGDQEPQRLTVLGYIDKGRAARVLREDGSEGLVSTDDLAKGLTAPPTVTEPPIVHPRRIEGEPVTMEDLDKAQGDFAQANLERERTTAERAASANMSPEAFARGQARGEARVEAAANVLPGINTQALDLANQHERRALALLQMGRPDEARTEMAAAQRWREQFGAPTEPPFFTPEEIARGQAQRVGQGPEIMGQTPGARSNAPEAFTPEEIERARQIGSQRGPAGAPITAEEVENAPPPNVPNILGQEVPGRTNAPEMFTPEELQTARGQLAAERASRQPAEEAPAQGILGAEMPTRGRPAREKPTPPTRVPLLAQLPKQPQRLIDWVRANGGVNDEGGDLRQTLAGNGKAPFKKAIVNPEGRSLEQMAFAAWEDGYLPNVPYDSLSQIGDRIVTKGGADVSHDLVRPFLDAIDEDYNRNPVYSDRDSAAVESYSRLRQANSEVYEVADRLGIELKRGMTRGEFENLVRQRESEQDGEADAAHAADAFDADELGSEGEFPDYHEEFGTPRTLEDLESEYASERGETGETTARTPENPPATGEAGPVGGPGGAPGGIVPEGGLGAPAGRYATERTEQGVQQVIPGAEGASPEELRARQQARQREEDQLRAKTFRLEQPEIPSTEDQLAERGMLSSGPYRSLIDDFFDYLGDHLPAREDVEGWIGAVRHWLIDRDFETALEHAAIYDPQIGEVTHAGTNGAGGYVEIPDGFNEGDDVSVHHNHPDGTSLSDADVSALALPGIGEIFAHGAGDMFGARATPTLLSWMSNRPAVDSMAALSKMWNKAFSIIAPRIEMQRKAGHIDELDQLGLATDLTNRALAAAGLIDYVGTRPSGPLSDYVVRSMVRNAGEAVAATGRNIGLKLRYGKDLEGVLDRSTNSVPLERALGGVPPNGAEVAPSPGSNASNPVRGAGAEGEAPIGEGKRRLFQVSAGLGHNQGPELEPERSPTVPEGTDYIDQVGEEIAAARGGEPAGTYARRSALPPAQARAENGRRFNAVNRDFTTPMGLARRDWRSAQYWNANQALSDDASKLRASYRDLLPTFLTATPAEIADVMKVREWRRLKGDPSPTDGRATVIYNDGSVPAQLSGLHERVYLDNDRLIKIDSELTQAFQKAWGDVTAATAKKFGWHGVPTSDEIFKAADKAVSGRDRRSLMRVGSLIMAMEGQQRAGYTPFMRFGNYFFAVKPKAATEAAAKAGYEGEGFPPVVNFQLADSHTPWEKAVGGPYVEGETPAEMQKKLAGLREQFPEDQYDIEHGYLFAKENQLRDLNVPAIEKLLVLVGNDVRDELRRQAKVSSDPAMAKKIGGEITDLYGRIQDGILDQAYREMRAGFKRQASNTPGWDPDLARSSAVYLNHVSQHVAGLRHQENIDRIYDALIQKHPDEQVRSFWREWRDRNDTPRTMLDSALNVARRAAFLYALGGNAATSAKIMMHGPLLGVPTLSTGLGADGHIATVGAYTRAITQVLTGLRGDTTNGIHLDWRKIRGLSNSERVMLQYLDSIGALHAQGADELAAIRNAGEDAFEPQAKFNRRVLNIWASNVVAADQMTRAAMALSAFRMASDPKIMARMERSWRTDQLFQGMYRAGKVTPEDIARFMVERTAGVYGNVNRMPVLRGRWGGMMGQFRAYEVQYAGVLNQLLRDMGPEGKASAGLMLGGLFSLGGLMAWPFVQDVKNAGEAAYQGLTGIAPDIGNMIDSAAHSLHMSKSAAEVVLHGFSRSAFGVELGQGLGFGDLISRQTGSALNILGPAASIFGGDLYRAYERHRGDQTPAAWMSEMLPNAFKNAVRAYIVYPQQGIASAARGTTIIPPSDITPGMQVRTALGFEPADVARAYEKEGVAYSLRSAHEGAVGALEDRGANLLSRANALESTDPKQAAALRKEWNDILSAAAPRLQLGGDELRAIHTTIMHRLQGAQNPDIRRLREVPKTERQQYIRQEGIQP